MESVRSAFRTVGSNLTVAINSNSEPDNSTQINSTKVRTLATLDYLNRIKNIFNTMAFIISACIACQVMDCRFVYIYIL